VFCSISTKHTKHPKNTGKTKKNSQYARSCIAGIFQELKNSTVLHKTPFTKHLQNTAKHSQNSHKTRFVKLRRKTPQNKRKTLKNVTKRSQYSRNTYCLRAFGVFFQNTLDLSQKYTIRNTRKLRGVSRTPAGGLRGSRSRGRGGGSRDHVAA